MKESTETLNTHAIELATQGDYPEAIACFLRAISIENENHLLWYNLGITYRDTGNFTQAKAALLKAYELHGDDEDILETLALVCYSLNEYAEALSYCFIALELNDSNTHIWNTVGVLYFANLNYALACHAFEHAVMIDPYYYDALFNLHDTYEKLNNTVGQEECRRRMDSLQHRGEL